MMKAQPIETLPTDRPVLVWSNDVGWCYVKASADDPIPSHWTHWMEQPPAPKPDPMTVVARHPMDTLPDNHPEWVLIQYRADSVSVVRRTTRDSDGLDREWWCPLEPLLALIPSEGETT